MKNISKNDSVCLLDPVLLFNLILHTHISLIRMIHRITRLISLPYVRTLSAANNDVTPVVSKEQIGSCGVLSLHRPKTMNALNAEMFDLISPQLIEWEKDSSIKSILIKGRDRKVFSAGGEIKKVLDKDLNEEDLSLHLSKEYSLGNLVTIR